MGMLILRKILFYSKKKIYYKTGDNFIKKNGNYFFKVKDYIKVSGYRVNLQELENKLFNKFNLEDTLNLVIIILIYF